VFATVDASAGYKGITAFLVEKNTPGFSVGRKEDKLGIRASSTCELILDECEVAETQVLGEAGSGYKIAMETLNGGRIGIGAQMLGLAEGAWAHAMKHAKQRKQFGKTLVPGDAVPACGDGDGRGSGAADGLQRGAAKGRRPGVS
jgi:alkylation response protein AidB-like acyl-CoA dehydrogenase